MRCTDEQTIFYKLSVLSRQTPFPSIQTQKYWAVEIHNFLVINSDNLRQDSILPEDGRLSKEKCFFTSRRAVIQNKLFRMRIPRGKLLIYVGRDGLGPAEIVIARDEPRQFRYQRFESPPKSDFFQRVIQPSRSYAEVPAKDKRTLIESVQAITSSLN